MDMFNEVLDGLQQIVRFEAKKSSLNDRYVSLCFENLMLKYDIKALYLQSDDDDEYSTTHSLPSPAEAESLDNEHKEESVTESNSSNEEVIPNPARRAIQFIGYSPNPSCDESLKWDCLHEKIPVHICCDVPSVNKIINAILAEHGGKPFVMGLDCEWTPDLPKYHYVKSKVGLLQLATANRIVLIRFSSMKFKVAEALKRLLGDARILKTGVGVMDDVEKMKKDLGVITKGMIYFYLIHDVDPIFNLFIG